MVGRKAQIARVRTCAGYSACRTGTSEGGRGPKVRPVRVREKNRVLCSLSRSPAPPLSLSLPPFPTNACACYEPVNLSAFPSLSCCVVSVSPSLPDLRGGGALAVQD